MNNYNITLGLRNYTNAYCSYIGSDMKYKIAFVALEHGKSIRTRPFYTWSMCLRISDTIGNFAYFFFRADSLDDDCTYWFFRNKKHANKTVRNDNYLPIRPFLIKIDTNKELQEHVPDEFKRHNRKVRVGLMIEDSINKARMRKLNAKKKRSRAFALFKGKRRRRIIRLQKAARIKLKQEREQQ
jgi:hypothetical protein